MTAAACKAVICEEKAQAESEAVIQIIEKFKGGLENFPELRIEISEMVIDSNKRLATRIMRKIQNTLPDT